MRRRRVPVAVVGVTRASGMPDLGKPVGSGRDAVGVPGSIGGSGRVVVLQGDAVRRTCSGLPLTRQDWNSAHCRARSDLLSSLAKSFGKKAVRMVEEPWGKNGDTN